MEELNQEIPNEIVMQIISESAINLQTARMLSKSIKRLSTREFIRCMLRRVDHGYASHLTNCPSTTPLYVTVNSNHKVGHYLHSMKTNLYSSMLDKKAIVFIGHVVDICRIDSLERFSSGYSAGEDEPLATLIQDLSRENIIKYLDHEDKGSSYNLESVTVILGYNERSTFLRNRYAELRSESRQVFDQELENYLLESLASELESDTSMKTLNSNYWLYMNCMSVCPEKIQEAQGKSNLTIEDISDKFVDFHRDMETPERTAMLVKLLEQELKRVFRES